MRPLQAVPSAQTPSPGERPRVHALLAKAAERRIIFVQGAAGSGKSVAVRGFLGARPHVWVRVDPLRATLQEVVLDMALALGDPWRASVATLIAQTAAAPDAPEQMARWLVANGIPTQVLVMDDLHHLPHDHPFWRFLSHALTAPALRWICISRAEMPVPISSLILSGDAAPPVNGSALAFTPEEIREAAAAQELSLSEPAINAILSLTGGWAAGVAFALIAAAQNSDLTRMSFETRELAFRYFSEQYFASLDAGERRLLYAVALCGEARMEVFDRLEIPRVAETLENMVGRIAFVERTVEGRVRLHDLFREFLLSALQREDSERLHLAPRVAEALEICGDIVGALELRLRTKDDQAVLRILRAHGDRLVEEGRYALMERAIAIIPRAAQRSDGTALTVRAELARAHGDFPQAMTLYQRAIEALFDPNDRWLAALRLSVLRVNRWQSGASEPVLPYMEDANIERRAEALSIAALGAIVDGHFEIARDRISAAMAEFEGIDDTKIQIRVIARAAYVSFYIGDVERVEHYATEAVARSEEAHFLETAADCYSILYAQAYTMHEMALALYYLRKMERSAERSGISHLRLSAIRGQFEIEAYRGREDRMEVLEAQIRNAPRDGYRDSLPYLHAKALSFAWHGDFAQAVRLLYALTADSGAESARQLAFGLLAFYCAADGRPEEAQKYLNMLQRRTAASDPVDGDYFWTRAVFAATAMVLLGRGKAARRFLSGERVLFSNNRGHLYDALLNLTMNQGAAGLSQCALAFEHGGFGGMGRVLHLLAERQEQESGPTPTLTATETEILRALADGESAKEVALRTGRSYETVRSHVKAISKKLGCSGMLEAVATARRLHLL